jgi:EAL domain-containing protein (putative c-di-GMP-specific phosphodiesterase class I)
MTAWLEQRDVLFGIRKSGIRVAIDDFGTGFSSLQYLTCFPLDRLKIAQAFVADVCDAQGRPTLGNAAIVKATIGLARELGLQVVAEGVETHEQLVLLRSWGCREVQGYYLAKPAPSDEVEELLRRKVIRPPTSRPAASGPSATQPPKDSAAGCR